MVSHNGEIPVVSAGMGTLRLLLAKKKIIKYLVSVMELITTCDEFGEMNWDANTIVLTLYFRKHQWSLCTMLTDRLLLHSVQFDSAKTLFTDLVSI